MPVIGTFKLAKDGGWTGMVQTVTFNAKLRLVPNDNRDSDKAPMFRAFVGQSRVGEAWAVRTETGPAREYLQLKLDDPSWSKPVSMALFPSEDGNEAQLVWNRR